jgi:cation:H+ antiporter
MAAMLLPVLAVVLGFFVLVWGADRFVTGAAATARDLGVSTLVIGLIIVGFGTSAPEILVSVTASITGNPGLAIGNALGSNISNIGLVLGGTALVGTLVVRSETLKREYPILMVITLMTFGLVVDRQLGRLDGVLLLASLSLILYWLVLITLNRRRNRDPLTAELGEEFSTGIPLARAVGLLAVGFVGLMVSSRILVWGAVAIAQYLGVSDLLIGLTIVAIGTSLPELAAGVTSAIKGEGDIAIGNVIGSNIFNTLAVLAIPALIRPMTVAEEVVRRDFPICIAATAGLFVLAWGPHGDGRIGRRGALVLLGGFVGYQWLLFLSAVGGP